MYFRTGKDVFDAVYERVCDTRSVSGMSRAWWARAANDVVATMYNEYEMDEDDVRSLVTYVIGEEYDPSRMLNARPIETLGSMMFETRRERDIRNAE